MKTFPGVLLVSALLFCNSSRTGAAGQRPSQPANSPSTIFGFRDSAAEMNLESRFLAVPDPKLAEEHLRTLTQAPHIAGSPEIYSAGVRREAFIDAMKRHVPSKRRPKIYEGDFRFEGGSAAAKRIDPFATRHPDRAAVIPAARTQIIQNCFSRWRGIVP